MTNFIETVLQQRLAKAVASSSSVPDAPPARSANQTKDKSTHAT